MSFRWITPDQPALVLAPMEGVTDAPMRALLTERGGFSYCVSEFLRVSNEVLPARSFLTHVPELKDGARTQSGTPIQFQLLGGNEERLALCAARACDLGARAIDLNFGCPAPTVNRHDGGAALLRHPDRIRRIVAAVRATLPKEIPVSAKLRLGWENVEDIFVNAEAALAGGASWLTIHARTKVQGYAPPVNWKLIGEVKKRLSVPIIANGDIWTIEDFLRCREETECQHFMIGRGALADPALPTEIARRLGLPTPAVATPYPHSRAPRDWEPVLRRFAEICDSYAPETQYTTRRIKQWLGFANMQNPLPWYQELKRVQSLQEAFAILTQDNKSSACLLSSSRFSERVNHLSSAPSISR